MTRGEREYRNSDKTQQPPLSEGKRRKREQYTLIACFQCKARKVKCDGCRPCQCCQKRKISCTFPNRSNLVEESVTASLISTQQPPAPQAVELVEQRLTFEQSLASSGAQILDPCHAISPGSQADCNPSIPAASSSSHSGDFAYRADPGDASFPAHRTTVVHTFNLARLSLEANGVMQPEKMTSTKDPPPLRQQSRIDVSPFIDFDQDAGPIFELGYDRASCALSSFFKNLYPLYPCVERSSLQEHLDYIFIESVHIERDEESRHKQCHITLVGVDILKAVLGTSMLVENIEGSPLALHLPRFLDWSVEKFVMGKATKVTDVIMATLMGIYFFYKCELVKAWRLIGIASNACFELGLNKTPKAMSNSLKYADASFLRRLFCCVYIVDHRFAFATGLPYSMQDGDIDENCFELKASAPFLAVSVEYDRICSEIFMSVSKLGQNGPGEHQQIEFLDYKLLALPEKFETLVAEAESSGVRDLRQDDRLLKNLQTILLIRINHARTLLRKTQLQSYRSGGSEQRAARVAADCACDTISLCSTMINESLALRSIRTTYDFFLLSALATVLLVVSQDPEIYGERYRQSFYEAIEILEASQCLLWVPQKLCFTIDQLKEIGQRIKMPKNSSSSTQQWTNDAEFWQSFASDQFQSFDDGLFGLLYTNEHW